jgi:hypothetical protein
MVGTFARNGWNECPDSLEKVTRIIQAMQPKYFLPVKGAGHNDTFVVGGEGYFNALADFVNNSRLYGLMKEK